MAKLLCSPNAALAFDFFVSKGLTDFQAAGVVGNLQQESQLNPRNYPPSATAEQAFGIAAWHTDRWLKLRSFFSNLDPWAFDTQLEFVWHELQTDPSYGLAKLRASTTVEDATLAFQDNFEKCGDCRPNTRIGYAKSVLYACPAISTPPRNNTATAIAAAAFGALFAAVSYGAYKAWSSRTPKRPTYTPNPTPLPYVPPRPRPRPIDPFGAPR